MPGLPTRQIIYIFVGIVLLFRLHASFPEWWEELVPTGIVRYVHQYRHWRLKHHVCQGGESAWPHCMKSYTHGDKEKEKKEKVKTVEDPELIWDNVSRSGGVCFRSSHSLQQVYSVVDPITPDPFLGILLSRNTYPLRMRAFTRMSAI